MSPHPPVIPAQAGIQPPDQNVHPFYSPQNRVSSPRTTAEGLSGASGGRFILQEERFLLQNESSIAQEDIFFSQDGGSILQIGNFFLHAEISIAQKERFFLSNGKILLHVEGFILQEGRFLMQTERVLVQEEGFFLQGQCLRVHEAMSRVQPGNAPQHEQKSHLRVDSVCLQSGTLFVPVLVCSLHEHIFISHPHTVIAHDGSIAVRDHRFFMHDCAATKQQPLQGGAATVSLGPEGATIPSEALIRPHAARPIVRAPHGN